MHKSSPRRFVSDKAMHYAKSQLQQSCCSLNLPAVLGKSTLHILNDVLTLASWALRGCFAKNRNRKRSYEKLLKEFTQSLSQCCTSSEHPFSFTPSTPMHKLLVTVNEVIGSFEPISYCFEAYSLLSAA